MKWEERRVLVTGTSGFVGPVLAKRLIEMGAEVYGLDRRKSQETSPQRVRDLKIEDELKQIECDMTDPSGIASHIASIEPEVVIHLAAQSFVPHSFRNPGETFQTNIVGTANLLEAIRFKGLDPVFIFSGSSEEYGLVISSEEQYKELLSKYGTIFPPPKQIPELPIVEESPLRPMSPYAVTKVACDYMTRNYHSTFGLKALVSRAFNHEGAGRGVMFVTSAIVRQIVALKAGEIEHIQLGNISAFRDWSHVDDTVNGYVLLAEKGRPGEVYNQGSQRTNSVLTYLLWSLEEAGFEVSSLKSMKRDTVVDNPTEPDRDPIFGIDFPKAKVDRLLMEKSLSFSLEDGGIVVDAGDDSVKVVFDKNRFRPSEVPILLSGTEKIRGLGAKFDTPVKKIISDQMGYFQVRNE
jgi:GDPmannose 4,6-dehydratase